MSAPIDGLSSAALAAAVRGETRPTTRIGGELTIGEPRVGEAAPDGGFGKVLEAAIVSANAKERQAVEGARALADGRSDDLHGTMITMKEAEVSMKLVGNVRDKLLDAFHELWRINV